MVADERLGCVCGLEGDLVAELLELADQPLGVAVGGLLLALLKVVLPQVVVGDPTGEDVVGDHQDRVADRDRCPARPSAAFEPVVLGTEIAVLGPGGATWSPCGCDPSRACRPTRCCPGTSPPTRPGAPRRGTGPCRCRSRRPGPQRCGYPRRGWWQAASPARRTG